MNDLKQLGEYTLLERIGRGGMSEVYRATSASGKDIAIKLVRVDPRQEDNEVFLQRFEREARIIADLHHPHILPILDFGKDAAVVYIAMPYIHGGTLAEMLRREPLSLTVTCRILAQLGSALDHAHKLQIIHRDLKPSNVLIDDKGDAYLTDFGIARFAHMVRDLTETGNVMGTPAYMAPEQWRAEALDARTDVYGLGVVAYLMLTTHTPFEADNPHQMMYQHFNQLPPPMRDYQAAIPAAVEQVIFRALNKSAQDRYPSVGAFATDFENAINGKPIQVVVSTPAPPLPPPIYAKKYYQMPSQTAAKRTYGWRVYAALVVFLAVLLIGSVATAVFAISMAGDDKPAPTATYFSTPNNAPIDVPRVVINSPGITSTASVNETITIAFTAYDRVGINRIELRPANDNEPLESLPVDGLTAFSGEFTYIPTKTGLHRLEIIAFRGEQAGAPRFFTIEVKDE